MRGCPVRRPRVSRGRRLAEEIGGNSVTKGIPVRAGETCELLIERLGSHAEGVARAEGFTVFVPGALPGEKVLARVVTVKKSYAAATLVEIRQTSPDRTDPVCPVYDVCGGCQLQHLSYEAQLREKRRQVEDAVHHIGKLDGVKVFSTIGGESWGYRNKMQFPVGRIKATPVIGCFAQGSHDIVDTEKCYIQHQTNNDLMNAMRSYRRPCWCQRRLDGGHRDGEKGTAQGKGNREIFEDEGAAAGQRSSKYSDLSEQLNHGAGNEAPMGKGRDSRHDRPAVFPSFAPVVFSGQYGAGCGVVWKSVGICKPWGWGNGN